MWQKFRAIFTIPELRQKIIFTAILLGVFRIGYHIPLPVVNQAQLAANMDSQSNELAKFFTNVAVFSAADLKQVTIFGLGIMPYISASIILQLLGSVWKPLEDLRKEGETGRKKINEYTRYLTVAMCVVQSMMFLGTMLSSGDGQASTIHPDFLSGNSLHWSWYITCILTMTCGTMFVMWIGEQIDEFGIGNGISLLIMAGILAQMPVALIDFTTNMKWSLTAFSEVGIEHIVVLAILFVAVVFGVVFITLGQRQIPTQSAKHVRGRRQFGGGRQYLPLRLNQSGVMPIIFASSLLMLPAFIFGLIASSFAGSESDSGQTTAKFFYELQGMFASGTSFTYIVCYVILIYFFSYFWTAITFNPKEMADNLKDFGTFIPGYRPGRRTAEHLEKVMVRITYVGAAFLSLVAIVPTFVSSALNVAPNVASFYGGTGLLIAVSVAFDLIQKIDSHLVMRDYRGLLEP
ncbi:preprotein translocase, SecY subunit [Pirellula staleyi DSM 6068]|uniref:Protein translocase subunit SecY n=1 Tax=Pirellula staleyi (strain ATCC 27377 / DSM 6068 / ICPB 4128) TaxID=530564 RepID=D2R6I9_PIRSD|nr:preprotein translocase subunit SecY [Pirellula staleyi]ADB17289.1 preprotein translocase, SecY subunit [Pirellula staleyi DSM 6068]